MGHIFITGGARSGKSSFAQEIADNLCLDEKIKGKKIVYLATSRILDEEMRQRVEIHRQARPTGWETFEEPLDLDAVAEKVPSQTGIILLDCLTAWLSNMLFQFTENLSALEKEIGGEAVSEKTTQLLSPQNEIKLEEECRQKITRFLSETEKRSIICLIVTNELGCGIVPEHYLGRFFRDLAGRINQLAAAHAREAYLVVSGIPVKIK